MKYIKFISLSFLVLFVYTSKSQEVKNESLIDIDRIFNTSDFREDYFGSYKWYDGGKYYSKLVPSKEIDKAYDILLTSSSSGETKVLIDAKDLLINDDTPIFIEDYFWSDDLNKMLIFTNSKRVWRSNTKGDYWIYDLKSKELFQVGQGLEPSSLMFAKFSPDGKKVAFVSKNNVYVQDLESKKIKQLTFDGTVSIINGTFDWVYEEELKCRDGFRWSPDSKKIAYWQLDASKIRDFYMISNLDSTYSQIIPVQYPKVGMNPSSAKIGILDIKNSKTNWIPLPGDPYQHYLPRMQWMNDDNKLVIHQLNRKQNELKLWLYDTKNKQLKNIYTDKDKAWIDIEWPDIAQTRWKPDELIFFNDNNNFIWVSEKDGWRHLYNVNINTGNETLITKGDYDIATLYCYDSKHKTIYFNASPNNSTERYLYKIGIDGKNIERLTPQKNKGVNLYDISPNCDYAIHRFSSINHVPTVDLISLKSHTTLKNLVDNKKLEETYSKLKLGSTEFFSIDIGDGFEADGYMIKPPNFDENKKYPVLFYVYGEPAGQTATNRWIRAWNLMLSQKGVIVISLDNRGTPCLKGREWRKSIYTNVGVLNTRDQATAIKSISKWKFIDTSRIGVWGWSGGGSMTLNLLFRYPELFKMGISVAPVTNLLYYDNIYEERYMGLPEDNYEKYIEGSPVTFAKNLNANLLLIHGTGDDNVHYQNAEVLIDELVKHGKQFDLMSYPNRSHSIYERPGTRKHLYTLLTNYILENFGLE